MEPYLSCPCPSTLSGPDRFLGSLLFVPRHRTGQTLRAALLQLWGAPGWRTPLYSWNGGGAA